eukprot:CFRG3404T1
MAFKIYTLTGLFRRKDTFVVVLFIVAILLLMKGDGEAYYPSSLDVLSRRGKNKGNSDAGIILYRSVGNNIPGYHSHGHARVLIEKILQEERLPSTIRRKWLLWHIADTKAKKLLIKILDQHDEEYTDVPFDLNEFAELQVREDALKDITNLHRLPDMTKVTVREMLGYYSERYSYFWGSEGTAVAYNYMIEDIFRPDTLSRKRNEVDEHESDTEFVQSKYSTESSKKSKVPEWVITSCLNTILDSSSAQLLIKAVAKSKNKKNENYMVLKGEALVPEDKALLPADRAKSLGNLGETVVTRVPVFLGFRRTAQTFFSRNLRHFDENAAPELLQVLGYNGEKYLTTVSSDEVVRRIQPNKDQAVVAVSATLKNAIELKSKKTNGEYSKFKSINSLIASLEVKLMRTHVQFQQSSLLTFDENILMKEKSAYTYKSSPPLTALVTQLVDMADAALKLKPFSVTDKLETPPSGDKHDYYTPAPYYWPNPKNPKGPYIVRDGERVPGTGLYDNLSEKYDRSRISSFFGNTTVLALAWYFTDDARYAEHAALNIRTWFIDENTRMNPHLKFAQLRKGHKKDITNGGFQSGIIETKDMYFVLDTVRLVHRSGKLSVAEYRKVQSWTAEFLKYITEKRQGTNERKSKNNHGTYYDIQVAALAAFSDDVVLFRRSMERSRARVIEQFAMDGSMPDEMKRPTQLHYMLFSLQGWYTLATLASKAGVDIWSYIPANHTDPALRNAAKFTVPYFNETWTHHQTTTEDMDRMLPLYFMARRHYKDLKVAKSPGRSLYEVNPRFNEHDGIGIFWNLGLYDCTKNACE